MQRQCRFCDKIKDISLFRVANGNVTFKCKACRNQDEMRLVRMNRYGVTPEMFEAMLEEQDNACAICLEPFGQYQKAERDRTPHVDHDHESGKVRGLLCGTCNKGLGQFKDNAAIVFSAYRYLSSQEDN